MASTERHSRHKSSCVNPLFLVSASTKRHKSAIVNPLFLVSASTKRHKSACVNPLFLVLTSTWKHLKGWNFTHASQMLYYCLSTWQISHTKKFPLWRLRQDGNLKHRIHIFDKQISSGDSRDGAWLSFLVSCKIHDRMKFLIHQDVCFEGHRAGRKNIVYVEAGKECKNVDIRWSMIHDNWKAEDKSLRCEKQEGGVWMRNLPTPTPPPKVFKW